MAFNDDHTLIDLFGIRSSFEYQDQHAAGPQNESLNASGIPDVADFNDNFNRALSAIRRIIHGVGSGVGNWYDAPSIGLSGLHQAILGVNTSGMQTWTDAYNHGSGILDMSSFDADVRIPNGRVWSFNDGDGLNPIAEVTNSGMQLREVGSRQIQTITSNIAAGATIVVPNGASYTPGDPITDQYRNLRFYVNTGLMSPGSGIASGDEKRRDYQEASSTSIVTNRKITASAGRPARLEFHIMG